MEYVVKENGVDCKVFLDRFMLDKGTMTQLKTMIYHPSLAKSKIRVMPDCHRSTSCMVGMTYELGDKIVPAHIGVDIGCGMLMHFIGNILDNFKIEELENIIKTNVPMGTWDDCVFKEPIAIDADIDEICITAYDEAINFALAYEKKFGVNIMKFMPAYSLKWFKEKCQQIGIDYSYAMRGLSSLGGGNHFCEVNIDKNNQYYLSIHSGSRNFGAKICKHHQDKINDTKYFDRDEFDERMKNPARKIKDHKILKKIQDEVGKEISDGRHTDYLEGDEAYLYYFDMIFAQQYARLNRRLMVKQVLQQLDIKFDEGKCIESIHNYIDFEDLIVRKGAISAKKDQKCIIALNMADGLLICSGKGNGDFNNSCAHGAGRLVMRGQVQNKVSMKEFRESMKDVYSTTVCVETLDESKFAYKDSELIKKAIDPTVNIIQQLKPVINVKATT